MKPTVWNAIDYFHSTDGPIGISDHILSTNSGKGRIFKVLCDFTNSTCPKTGQILGISVKILQGKAGQISKSAFGLIIKVAND